MLKRIGLLTLLLMFIFGASCWATEKPLGNITSEKDVIDKVFSGRTLDPIEGIWVRDEEKVIAIVKSSVLYPNQSPQKYDYLVIKVSGDWKNPGEVWEGLKRTRYDFSFKGECFWKLLSPNLLEHGVWFGGAYSFMPSDTYIRTYPTP